MKKCTIVRTSLTLIAASIRYGWRALSYQWIYNNRKLTVVLQLSPCPRCQQSLCDIHGAQTGGPEDHGNVGHGNTGTANIGNENVGSHNVGNGNTGRNNVGNGNTGSNFVGDPTYSYNSFSSFFFGVH